VGDVSISVIIPVFNGEKTICRALESALGQTFPPQEVWIIDDGSTDGTRQVVEAFVGEKVHYLYQANAGVASARNRGMQAASGDLLAFLDADDYWDPDKLAKQMKAINEGADLVYTGRWIYGPDGEVSVENARTYDSPLDGLRKRIHILTSVILVRSSIAHAAGGFDLDLRGPEDWDFVIRLAKAGARFSAVEEPLVHYDNSSLGSLSHSDRIWAEEVKVLSKGDILFGLKGIRRVCGRRKVLSAIFLRAALNARGKGKPGKEVAHLLRSIGSWPSKQACKVLLVTTLRYLRLYPT
jgi:glycosyltransferase involved in cell wall biosynthesis